MEQVLHYPETLIYWPELGRGYYPVQCDGVYDASYFEKYQGYAKTETGKAITKARNDLVSRHWKGELVDIGIGCGDFVESRPMTYGYDVNPVGVEWLKAKNKYRDPYRTPVNAVTCWDSLEHIQNPEALLNNVLSHVFVSIPIFENAEHILQSKHFRKDEHFHYFTHNGFVKYMETLGFEVLECSQMETDLGRDGINSYAFRRQ